MSSFHESINSLKKELAQTEKTPKNKTDNLQKKNYIQEFNFGSTSGEDFNVEFENMKKKWKSLYENDNIEKFSLVFKTDESDFSIPIQYVYYMHVFLSELRGLRYENPVKYGKLNETIITIKSGNLRFLLNMLFKLISPFSNVYLVSDDKQTDTILYYVKNNREIPKNIDDVTYIPAGSSGI